MISVKSIDGEKNVIKALNKKIKASDEQLLKALYTGGLFLQRESMKLVPVDTGDLRRSATTKTDDKAKKPTVTVGYGTTYGLFVHEDLFANHKPGKQAKFLEMPFREKRDGILRSVTIALNKLIKKDK